MRSVPLLYFVITMETIVKAKDFTKYVASQTQNAKVWLEEASKAESREEFLWKFREAQKVVSEVADKAKERCASQSFEASD